MALLYFVLCCGGQSLIPHRTKQYCYCPYTPIRASTLGGETLIPPFPFVEDHFALLSSPTLQRQVSAPSQPTPSPSLPPLSTIRRQSSGFAPTTRLACSHRLTFSSHSAACLREIGGGKWYRTGEMGEMVTSWSNLSGYLAPRPHLPPEAFLVCVCAGNTLRLIYHCPVLPTSLGGMLSAVV